MDCTGRAAPEVHTWRDIAKAKRIKDATNDRGHRGVEGVPATSTPGRPSRIVVAVLFGNIDFVPLPLFARGNLRLVESFALVLIQHPCISILVEV